MPELTTAHSVESAQAKAEVTIVVAFRSLVLALVTAISTLLSAAAAFGIITLVFQTLGGDTVVSHVPLFAFAVLSGLSTDYHVFVLTRIRELVADGLPTRAAVARGSASASPRRS